MSTASRASSAMVVMAVLVVAGIVASAALVVNRTVLDGPAAPVAQSGSVDEPVEVEAEPVHPPEWDPRVAEVVEFVEINRGLEFQHPVAIDFLTPEEFVAEVSFTEGELTEDELRDWRRQEAQLRGMGLLSSGVDSLDAINELQETGLLAYYSPETQRVSVKGTEMTPATRAIVAHELTHVLQDQHFDLEAYLSPSDPDAAGRRRAVVEGDAMIIQFLYIDRVLTPAERRSAANEERQVLDQVDDEEGGDPVLATLMGFPYTFGPPFVGVIGAGRGPEGVDELFRRPPASDAQLLDPALYLDDVGPEPVQALALPDRAELVHEGEMGSFSWLMVFAPYGDAPDVLDAVDGWAGDRYSVYELDGRVCTSAVLQADDASGADQLATLATSWAGALWAGGAVARRAGERSLELTTCDPGAEAPDVRADSIDSAVQLALSRLYDLVG